MPELSGALRGSANYTPEKLEQVRNFVSEFKSYLPEGTVFTHYEDRDPNFQANYPNSPKKDLGYDFVTPTEDVPNFFNNTAKVVYTGEDSGRGNYAAVTVEGYPDYVFIMSHLGEQLTVGSSYATGQTMVKQGSTGFSTNDHVDLRIVRLSDADPDGDGSFLGVPNKSIVGNLTVDTRDKALLGAIQRVGGN